jgi:hypothetical protein
MLRHALLFAVLLIGSPLALAQETSRTFRVPFHSVNGLILLDVKMTGKPAAVLLDTGAQTTVISPKLANLKPKDSRAFATVFQGTRAHADLLLSSDLSYKGDFYVMDFAETSKQAGTQIDGLLGENILRDFSSVRIDHQAGFVEFEK